MILQDTSDRSSWNSDFFAHNMVVKLALFFHEELKDKYCIVQTNRDPVAVLVPRGDSFRGRSLVENEMGMWPFRERKKTIRTSIGGVS